MSIVRDEEQQLLDVYLKAVSQYSASVKKMGSYPKSVISVQQVAAVVRSSGRWPR
jgi:hypothetical protein